MNLTSIRDRVAVDSVRWAPTRLYSGAIGAGARARVPVPLRAPVYRAFARWVGASLDEVELPLDRYASLGEFFARRLRADARDLDAQLAPSAVISPCDGKIAAAGQVRDGTLIQAKGRHYTLSALLACEPGDMPMAEASYFTVYLSPRDYHRVHCPVSAELVGYDYVPGRLFPVNPFFSNRVDNLLSTNERLILHFSSELGPMALVMVGATGVGNMTLCRPPLETREFRRARSVHRVRFDQPLAFTRGDELGAFQLGSTVVVVFDRSFVSEVDITAGESVRAGDVVAAAAHQRGEE